MDAGRPLANKNIVITRPKQQSGAISQRLSMLGAWVVEFPLIAIDVPSNKHVYQTQLSQLANYDYLVFTSRNAVEMTFSALAGMSSTVLPRPSFQQSISTHIIAAVGKQTAAALERHGVTVSIMPKTAFNSEALLEQEGFQQVAAKRIAIIRGEGGRDLLRSVLQERGAKVDYIDVYRRFCPMPDLLPLVKCREQRGVDIIVLTSVEGLNNLFALGAEQSWLKQTTLLVGSQRMADALKMMDHQGPVIITDDPSDDQVVSGLLSWAVNAN